MHVVRTNQVGVPVLQVHGALVGRNWQRFVAELKVMIAEGHPKVGIDLSQVTRMGQSEAHHLVDLRDSLSKRSRLLELVGLSPASIAALGLQAEHRRSRSRRLP